MAKPWPKVRGPTGLGASAFRAALRVKAPESGAAGEMRVPVRSAVASAYDAGAGSIADGGAAAVGDGGGGGGGGGVGFALRGAGVAGRSKSVTYRCGGRR